MMVNPFKTIYERCNRGNSKEKFNNLPDFPYYMDIELTNQCNFHCLMCPTGTDTVKREKGFMEDIVFYKFLQEVKEYKTPIRLVRWGEPTIHPKFKTFLKALKNADITCHINTNGTTLNSELMEFFFSIKLDSIKFSFQGISAETYREMRNVNYFDKLKNNIEIFYEMRGARKCPFIHVATTTTYETEDQIKMFKDNFSKHADLVTVGKTQLSHIDSGHNVLPKLDKLKKHESLEKYHFECPEVFDKLSLNWDGTVSACCGDYDNFMIVGNILENSLKEIWKSDKLNSIRKLLVEMRHDELELCRNCYDKMSLHKNTRHSTRHSNNKRDSS